MLATFQGQEFKQGSVEAKAEISDGGKTKMILVMAKDRHGFPLVLYSGGTFPGRLRFTDESDERQWTMLPEDKQAFDQEMVKAKLLAARFNS